MLRGFEGSQQSLQTKRAMSTIFETRRNLEVQEKDCPVASPTQEVTRSFVVRPESLGRCAVRCVAETLNFLKFMSLRDTLARCMPFIT